ncbi:acyl-CoA transferase [Teredinibacter sp. KSP-S5-2]|uniref:acyl-CoA transferase n=1 Tax=Teredinibacter sp. KSP-S5-2 TaxID=3034506 RepID=UPI00293508F5|nr:acyl-CoA transferase [Teredinibacter sp. KSP-S5-2]WNO09607.1 acyl-CoA transferase [Teredinibacter sp. KSP-S5-2]
MAQAPQLDSSPLSISDRDRHSESPFNPQGYVARIALDSPEDLKRALLRAESLYLDGKVEEVGKPLAFIIHGPEVEIFFKENYQQYKEIVDIAARLTAFKVVEVQVCETRMGVQGKEKSSLVPFVGTVPFGPSAIDELINKKDYVYF